MVEGRESCRIAAGGFSIRLGAASQSRPGEVTTPSTRLALRCVRSNTLTTSWSAAVTLAGVELMHMIRKGQLLLTGGLCPAQQFFSLTE
jgi:hypothetical protein